MHKATVIQFEAVHPDFHFHAQLFNSRGLRKQPSRLYAIPHFESLYYREGDQDGVITMGQFESKSRSASSVSSC